MGRSVSYRSGAAEVLYFYLPSIDDLREQRAEQAEDFGEDPEDVRGWSDEAFYDDLHWLYEDAVDSIRNGLSERFPSFEEDDAWPEREVRTIAGNSMTDIDISEYCGLVSVSITPRNKCEYCWRPCGCDPQHYLATSWTNRMVERIAETIYEVVSLEPLRKIGTFSNGESVYERVA